MGGIYIVVPAYNESKRITGVIKDLLSYGYQNIVVVDDGSRDDTGAVSMKAGATVLTHSVNRGQGAGLRTGIEYALKCGADIIVTFDSDGQHQASDLSRLIKPVKSGEYDIAIGSRFMGDSRGVPFMRKVLLLGSRVVILMFYGLWMTDAHNGLRAMSRKTAQSIEIKSNRMEHASEITGEIRAKRLRYIEVPVTIKYTQETLQKGHGGFIGAFRILIKMIIHKLTR